MKRTVKITALALLILFIGIQFIPRDHNEGKVPVGKELASVYPVPPNVQAIFQRSCNDCHSDHTHYPWYAQVQPFRYILDGHIRGGKAELNFDEFSAYTPRRQRSRLRAIDESLAEGSMPLSSYTMIHGNAVLTKEDKLLLENWIKSASVSQQ
jgi:hypothetical protein